MEFGRNVVGSMGAGAGGTGLVVERSSRSRRKRRYVNLGDVNIWSATEAVQESFSFVWEVRNFSLCQNIAEIKSDSFHGGSNGPSWQLKMTPRKKYDDRDYLGLHLVLHAFGEVVPMDNKLSVRFQINLLDEEGRAYRQVGSAEMGLCEFKRFSVWGYEKFILASELHNPVGGKQVLINDTLKIHCKIWSEIDLIHKSCIGLNVNTNRVTFEEEMKRSDEKLAVDIGNFLKNTATTDFTIISAEGEQIKVHKAILMARSPVFERMLTSQMTECVEATVTIPDFKAEQIKATVDYMYTGRTDWMPGKASELLPLAEKYDLSPLKSLCERALMTNICIENAASILILANLYNAPILKPFVAGYINANKSQVTATESFKNLVRDNPAVILDLYNAEDSDDVIIV